MNVIPSETGLETYEVRYRAATHGMRGSDRGTAAPQELRRGSGARTVYYTTVHTIEDVKHSNGTREHM